MKIMFYNTGYCTGIGNSHLEYFSRCYRFLLAPKKIVSNIAEFIKQQKPDIVGFAEIDSGSFRTGFRSQIKHISKKLNFDHRSYTCKYPKISPLAYTPIFKRHCNGIISKENPEEVKHHFLSAGFKRLFIEYKVKNITFFLAHLALRKHVRKRQIEEISSIMKACKTKKVLMGDFNIFDGKEELKQLMKENSLKFTDKDEKTFPSWDPKKHLDFILTSKDIKVKNFKTFNKNLSDHLPIMVELR